MRVSPSDREEYRPAGMEALEILHNQLQLLVSIYNYAVHKKGACEANQNFGGIVKLCSCVDSSEWDVWRLFCVFLL